MYSAKMRTLERYYTCSSEKQSALTTSQYAKLSNFPDKPLPPDVLELMKQPSQKHPHLEPNMGDLLARQRRRVKSVVGDRNCFYRAIAIVRRNNTCRSEMKS